MYAVLTATVFCTLYCKKEIRTSPELQQVFNEQELKDIALIVSFVEKKLLIYADTEDIDKAFQQFMQDNIENYYNKFDAFKYEEVEQLFTTINPQTFENIWIYRNKYSPILKDSLRTIDLAYEEKYMDFMEILSQKNLRIKEYIDKFKSTGSYTTSSFHPPLLTQFNLEKKILQAPRKFGDYNTRVYRAVEIITLFLTVHENKKMSKLHEEYRENLHKERNRKDN